MIEFDRIETGKWRENCYVVKDGQGNALIIDPGEDAELISNAIDSQKLKVLAILNTHAHFDHVAGVEALKVKYAVPFYLHGGDAKLLTQANFYRMIFEGKSVIQIPKIDHDLIDQPLLTFGKMEVKVIPGAGHTAGGVSFLIDDYLFSGDMILGSRVGRTDLPGGNKEALKASLQKLLALSETTTICPGHGKPQTLGEVKKINSELSQILSEVHS